MRASLEKWLTGIWYTKSEPPLVLRSLEAVYRRLSATGPVKQITAPASLAVIVVGNLSAGGTGKTPLVIALCKRLQAAGLRPGVISRGYGRNSKGLHIVSGTDDPQICGDESLLIKQETAVPVILAEDRRLAISAMDKTDVNIIIADDGLQNKQLPRDIEVCVIDGGRLFGNGHLIPAGPMREPAERLESVDHVVVNGDADQLENFLQDWCQLGHRPINQLSRMALKATKIAPLSEPGTVLNSSSDFNPWAGRKVHAVAAIGNPGRFYDTLQALGMQPSLHAFPDHHEYVAGDFENLQNQPIIMTAKDAVKCSRLGLKNTWVLSVAAEIEESFWNDLLEAATRLVNEKSEYTA